MCGKVYRTLHSGFRSAPTALTARCRNDQCWLAVVFIGWGLIGCETLFAKTELDLDTTEIERRGSASIEQQETEFRDGAHWALTELEWERVDVLTRGFRRFVSDERISPLEVLGIHARTEAERRRYARRWAELMIADAERVLAFQNAYDEVVRELVDEQPLIDLTQLPKRPSRASELLPSDRLAVFVSMNCAPCDALFDRVNRIGRKVAGVDIYAMDLGEDDVVELHQWAQRRGIPPAAVRTQRITLNLDDGLLARVHPRADKAPVLMRRRGDVLRPIGLWELP